MANDDWLEYKGAVELFRSLCRHTGGKMSVGQAEFLVKTAYASGEIRIGLRTRDWSRLVEDQEDHDSEDERILPHDTHFTYMSRREFNDLGREYGNSLCLNRDDLVDWFGRQYRPAKHQRKRLAVEQERAREIIASRFPDGPPSKHDMPNKVFCGEIQGAFLKRGDRPPSPDTILRAAGRKS